MLRCAPRLICFSVSVANQRSTKFNHEALVGSEMHMEAGMTGGRAWLSKPWVLSCERTLCFPSGRGKGLNQQPVEKGDWLRTHKWSRYTTAENHSLGFQGAEAVACFQFTPSSELQTSLVGMARGLRAPPPRTHSLLSK